MNTKTYTLSCAGRPAPVGGALLDIPIEILEPNCDIRLIRLYWDLKLYAVIGGVNVPVELANNNSQIYYLTLWGNTANDGSLANLFQNVPAGSVATYNGSNIMFARPGQYDFSTFITPNELTFAYSGYNWDPINAYIHDIFIVAEIELLEK